jgi:pSer/pThr/pTyr-binding forkhead associated (FHA) protein
VVTCDVCGGGNEENLTFCRNCGNRLRGPGGAAAGHGVAPTPATGLKKANFARPDEDDVDWELEPGFGSTPEPPPGRHARPSAPPLFFDRGSKPGNKGDNQGDGKSAAPTVPEPRAEPVPLEGAVPADKIQCDQCGALSPRNYRFCISCGAVLKKRGAALGAPAVPSAAPATAPASPAGKTGSNEGRQLPPPRPRTAPPTVREPARRDGAAVDAARVVSVEPDVGPPVAEVACQRCGGLCRPEEAFCKHCGTKLVARPLDKGAPRRQSGRPEEPDAPVELTHKIGGDGEPFPLTESAVASRSAASRGKQAAPQSRADVSGRLVIIVEDGSEGKALELRGRQVDLGSNEGDIVLPEDRYLSPRHARFFRQDGHWYLRDLGSVNGVYRRLRKPTSLRHGDLVLLGLEVLQFELVDHAERGLGHAIQHGVLVFGSPATTRRARLRQRTVEGVVRDVYHLVSDETTIGRETGDIVFTSDPFMSRRHAMITWDDDAQEYVLSDLNSSNGTYLAIRDDVRLDNGDFIRLGQHLFRVDLPSGPKAR